ncbi:tRNA (5-methylaminomethyl-2-thiouridine)(34)-methyltransferase MnmD [Candidatus Woesearchaeota archaeon]|jgi:tRNA U34 5-methylaminomethyl-2-thiouridine-forming methyltransferase MnmC|nr:tRNA (5-methylaminomethyl-2-thiouridine)(34)-methyltransferase MnmD [archaeon]MBT6505249.1 tRNA (5-methylaminomethyl-2-thiouridine)(34)-methyltransferase MnmD [Candidatus Woesearchaeota archaeon]MBT4351713.1 tRNA (5-methylaminomethyl-2-thiouridine)(34)-methyltransferase MnmD [archaeon]MBT4647778.1 tRNA (5-methylaminomethyl-2-thiouridine)(34)-methyltransferase MnmD [archaeon]MBT6821639.1 tRNA (5-methylaminomethyl-2-thiouridine)(34)-methyltransferase MnmD [archaeon]
MDKIITNDGSTTYYNEKYGDYYHSKSGAVEESFEKYVKPTLIPQLAKKGHIRILDIGFGLGYNVSAAIDSIFESNKGCHIEIESFEKDAELFKLIIDNEAPFKSYNLIKDLSKNYSPEKKKISLNYCNLSINVNIGDAIENIKKINGKFDACFLDAFSPKKNPELWSKEFFDDIYHHMRTNSILATFSCARMVRDNLKAAGFNVEDGPIVGRRSPSTIAIKL